MKVQRTNAVDPEEGWEAIEWKNTSDGGFSVKNVKVEGKITKWTPLTDLIKANPTLTTEVMKNYLVEKIQKHVAPINHFHVTSETGW